MHEGMLVSDLVRKVEMLALAHEARRVLCVRVRVGALSHVSPEHLEAHFSFAARNTIVEGARLEVEALVESIGAGAQDVVLESVDVE